MKNTILLIFLLVGLALIVMVIQGMAAEESKESYMPLIHQSSGGIISATTPEPVRVLPTPAPTMCIPSYWGDCISTPTPYKICLPEPCINGSKDDEK